MVPRDLVVFLEERQPWARRLAFAAALARQWQAHLIATWVLHPLALDPHAGFAVGPALAQMLDESKAASAAALDSARAAFAELTDRRSFSAEFRCSRDENGEALMLHARHADLAVLGPPQRQRSGISALGLSEQLVLACGRPCLLLPDSWTAVRLPRRIVVGWNGGREATRAISDAMPLLAAADTVQLVVVPEARTGKLLGAEPGADMATHLARHGVPVTLQQCEGDDAGAVLLARCAALDADLLVMGAMGRARISEIVFGGATRTVLEQARLPVLLSR